jgi:hypothetical protein
MATCKRASNLPHRWYIRFIPELRPDPKYFTPPHLPANYESLDEVDFMQVQEDFRRRQAHFF